MSVSAFRSDEFCDAPKGVRRSLFKAPRVSWKFAHQFPPPGELKYGSATTAYIVLWEGDGRSRESLDDRWEEIWNTWENDDTWKEGFGDGFVLQEALVEWEGPVPALEELEVMAGRSLVAPIQFDKSGWSNTHTHEKVEMGIWNSSKGLFVDNSGEYCLISLVRMIRNGNDPISLDIGSVDIDGEGDQCVQVVVPLDEFREQYLSAVPPRMETEKEESNRPIGQRKIFCVNGGLVSECISLSC